MTRARAIAVAVAMLLMSGIVGTASAQATNYRYWTYWSGTGQTWTFSAVGPSSAVPADGSVEGWRFAVSAGVGGQGAEPTINPAAAFQQFCGQVSAVAGKKRVAVVIDYGSASDAPSGQNPPAATGGCAQLPDNHTGGQVLQQVGEIRVEGGLICAINDYPQGECAPAISDKPSASASPKGAAPVTSPTDPTDSKDKKKDRGNNGQSANSGGANTDKSTPTPTRSEPKQTPAGSADSATPSPSASKSKKSSRPTASATGKNSPSATPDASESAAASSSTPSAADLGSNAEAVQTGQVSRSTGPSPLAVAVLLIVAGLAGWFLLRYRRRSS